MNQHKRIKQICEVCGEEFLARASDRRPGRGRTCSFRCSGRLGGKSKGAHLPGKAAHPSGTDLVGG